MALFTIPLPKQSAATANVQVRNTATVNWLILVIERVGEFQYAPIALKPNSTKNLNLPVGIYHFFFNFQNLAGAANLAVQVFTSHVKSPFPNAPKVVGAVMGQVGQTGITVEI